MQRQQIHGFLRGAATTAALLSLLAVLPRHVNAQQAQQHLGGTTWRLVSLTMNSQTVTPDDRQKYTISFQNNGIFAVHADCNRGTGRYVDPSGMLTLGTITLTRAHCAPGSIADQFARALGFTQSFNIQNGQLLLGIAPQGDTLRFEPSATRGK